MGNVKNYYDQQMELATVLFRIATLQEKKTLYFDRTQPSSPKYGEKVSASHKPSEPFLEYTAKVTDIDKELEELYKESAILEKYLRKMEINLRSMKGLLENIFVDRFIDNMDVKQIAKKYHYSESRIYDLIRDIKKIVKS